MSKPSLVRARENWHARYQGKKQIDVGSVFKVGRNCPLRESTLQKSPGWSAGLFVFAAFQPSLSILRSNSASRRVCHHPSQKRVCLMTEDSKIKGPASYFPSIEKSTGTPSLTG